MVMARISVDCPQCGHQIILDIKTIDDLRKENKELKAELHYLKTKPAADDNDSMRLFNSLFGRK